MADPVNKVVDMIPLPGPSDKLAAIGSALYATNPVDDAIAKVNIVTKEVEPRAAAGRGVVMLDFHRTVPIPDTIEQGPPDRRIYAVATNLTGSQEQLLEVTPGRFDTIVKRDLDAGTSVFTFVASPTKSVLYLADFGGKTVHVYDPDQDATVANISIAGEPELLAVGKNGRFVYACTPKIDEISVIDTAIDPPQVTRRLLARGDPTDMAVTPDDRRLILGQVFSTTVGIYDIESQTIRGVGVGREPNNVAVNAAGTRAYTSNFDTSTVCVVDLTLNPPRTIETIFGFAKPRGMSFGDDGRRLYVANGGPDSTGQHSISVVAV